MGLIAEWDSYRQEGNARTGKHSLEIIDTQGGLSGTFKIDFTNGFEIRDGGTPKDLWPVIQPRSLRFTMYVETAVHLSFVRGIGTSSDVARYIVIYKRGARPVFVGVVLTEATTFVRHNDIRIGGAVFINGLFSVTAVDGITMLNEVTFLESLIQRREPLIYWITQALSNMPTWPYLLNNCMLFQTSWVPDTGSANFVLNQSVASRVFFERVNRQGGVEFPSQYQVLSTICETFNMRLKSAYGYYFFQQLEDTSAPAYVYNKSGSLAGTSNTTTYIQDVDIDGLNLMDPHVETYSPPIKESKVTYRFSFNGNLARDVKINSNVYAETCWNDISLVFVQNETTRLRFYFTIEYTPTITGGFTGQLRTVFWLKIKVGSMYFARDLVTAGSYFHYQYKPEEWTSTETKYYIIPDALVTLPDNDQKKYFFPVDFATLKMSPAATYHNQQLSICFGHEAYDVDDNKIFESTVATQAIVGDLDVTAIDREDQVVEPVALDARIVNPGVANRIKIEREITFSSGPNKSSDNRITDDSSPPVDTINWSVPGQGSDLHYNQLAKSLMSRGMKAQTWMETRVEGPYQDLVPLRACGAVWVWWSGRYIMTTQEEYHQGEMLQVKLDPVSLEIEEHERTDLVHRPRNPTVDNGGPGKIARRLITGITTNRINADTYRIPMPDTTGWDEDEIAAIVDYNKGGNPQKYVSAPVIQDEFSWDNANRDFVLPEKTRAHIWHNFRIFKI